MECTFVPPSSARIPGGSGGEIMQHDNDILHVTRLLLPCHHGRGQQLLLADRVRVHPVRAGRKRELEGVC